MPTNSAEFHEEAAAEYDAAFDWYLERSPDAALKFGDNLAAKGWASPLCWLDGPGII